MPSSERRASILTKGLQRGGGLNESQCKSCDCPGHLKMAGTGKNSASGKLRAETLTGRAESWNESGALIRSVQDMERATQAKIPRFKSGVAAIQLRIGHRLP